MLKIDGLLKTQGLRRLDLRHVLLRDQRAWVEGPARFRESLLLGCGIKAGPLSVRRES